MSDIQFFAEPVDTPDSQHEVTLHVTANAPHLLGPALDAVETLLNNTPGVSVTIEAPGFTKAFYGFEWDTWSKR